MDFFEHQEQAHRRTFRLVFLYVLVVAVLATITYFLAIAVIGALPAGDKYLGNRLWDPQICVWTTSFTLVTILFGIIYKVAQLAEGGPFVARMLGGQRIDPDNCRADERVILNVVEEIAIASSTPMPPVYVMDAEESINAFAAGYGPQDAVIAVSRGALQYLSRDELQGVIAHEFSHLLNGDMRLNLRLVGILHGIMLISYFGDTVLRIGFGGDEDEIRESRGYGWQMPVVALGVGLQMIGFVGAFFGSLIKSGVSKQREFLADAAAIQFTRNPDGIGGALKKIGGLERGSRLRVRGAAQVSHLLFSSGVDASMINLFATHPPLSDRIRRIDANWDGKFPDTIAPHGMPRVALSTEEYTRGQPKQQPTADPGAPGIKPQLLQTAAMLAAAKQARQAARQQTAATAAEPEQTGTPEPEQRVDAQTVLASLPAALRTAIEEPLGAQAAVFALLLSDDAPVREKQLQALREPGLPELMERIEALTPAVKEVSTPVRLPLVEIAAPALRLLPEPQCREFRERVQELVDADERVSCFEFALLQSLKRQLQSDGAAPPRVRYTAVAPLMPACSQLLSVLAHLGSGDDKGAMAAFAHAASMLAPEGGLRLHDRYYATVRRADIALEEIAQAEPLLKRKIVAACTACISYDGKVTVEEAELLRAIADSLDCQLPPPARVETKEEPASCRQIQT